MPLYMTEPALMGGNAGWVLLRYERHLLAKNLV